MPRLLAVVLAVAALFALGACGDGRQGIVIDSDGSVGDNSPENARARAERLIARELKPRSATVAITQLPRWQDESRARAEGWYWSMVKVDVTLSVAPKSERERAEVAEIAASRLRGAVTGGEDSLLVTVHGPDPASVVVAPAAVAVAAAPAVAAAVAPVPGRHYIVQPGDSLGDISAVFYGTAQHWRLIVAANPGLDPFDLKAGTDLLIPARPVAPATEAPVGTAAPAAPAPAAPATVAPATVAPATVAPAPAAPAPLSPTPP